ncbi:MAG: hypothetical protein JXJ04_09000, partial [Spirochaetales bacterium]|nr:hypothetical protein [Spirochaetales bacterium]
QVIPLLKQIIKSADNTQKVYAIEALHRLSPKNLKKYLSTILTKETDEKVINSISEILKS